MLCIVVGVFICLYLLGSGDWAPRHGAISLGTDSLSNKLHKMWEVGDTCNDEPPSSYQIMKILQPKQAAFKGWKAGKTYSPLLRKLPKIGRIATSKNVS